MAMLNNQRVYLFIGSPPFTDPNGVDVPCKKAPLVPIDNSNNHQQSLTMGNNHHFHH
jgi:hypothetical protein